MDRVQAAVELHEIAVEMLRLKIQREKPRATRAQVEREIRAWLERRPGAEYGDTEGVPGKWPRRRRG